MGCDCDMLIAVINPPCFATFTTQVDAKHTATEMTTCQHLPSNNNPFLLMFVFLLSYICNFGVSTLSCSESLKTENKQTKFSGQCLRAY